MARRGKARQGMARRGWARQGKGGSVIAGVRKEVEE